MSAARGEQEIGAGVGWTQPVDGQGGYVVEHHGATADAVRAEIRASPAVMTSAHLGLDADLPARNGKRLRSAPRRSRWPWDPLSTISANRRPAGRSVRARRVRR